MPFAVTPNSYEVRDDVAYLDVGTKACPDVIALIDIADLGAALDGRGRWYAYRAHGRTNLGVRRSVQVGRGEQGYQLLPRVIKGSEPDRPVVIHLDHNGLNNRRANLRAVTHELMAIHARHSKAKIRGAYQTSSGRWKAIIGTGGQLVRLGLFDTAEEAGRAYDAAARERYGDLARFNFPPTD